jgi:HSP20 family protein
MSSFFEKLIGSQAAQEPTIKKPANKKPIAAKPEKPKALPKPQPKEKESSFAEDSEEPEEAEEIKEEEESEKETEPAKETKESKPEKKPIAISPEKIWGAKPGQLAIDVFQTETNVIVQSAIAGIKPEDLEVIIENGMLAVRGTRRQPPAEEDRKTVLQECYWGEFSRQFVLPCEVDPTRAEASLKEGILQIKIPRILKEKKTKLVVRE